MTKIDSDDDTDRLTQNERKDNDKKGKKMLKSKKMMTLKDDDSGMMVSR